MKKSLLALAVFGAFAGVASAQTSVTAYGIVDIGLVRESGNLGASVTKLDSGIESGSRLGFKGTEDLGGGLKAQFQLETGIAADTGGFNQGNLAFGRQSWVGLAGGFGSLSLGRQYQAQFIALDEVDPFGTGLAGSSTNLFTYPVGSRNNNMVNYTTPSFTGMSGTLQYGFGEVAGNTSAKRTIGAGLGYAAGPIVARLSYEKDQNALGTLATKYTQLTGSYDFAVVKLSLAYRKDKDDATLDTSNVLVGATVPFGQNTFLVSYIRRDDKSSLNQDANQVAVGYTYALSKRTDFYTAYARISNDNGAKYTVGNAISGGSNDKAFNLGIRHKF
ncbi:putative porin [Actimicrobium sp. GrIS 1.19]|uniref:porin n=1 Tax=Actimicrobium sp. GrIS 1.19 TaxID=3071708 RepID=UPI002E0C1C1C|nr:putative porin [Actimicrobium sp. GrIS 1.19]